MSLSFGKRAGLTGLTQSGRASIIGAFSGDALCGVGEVVLWELTAEIEALRWR
jgi:hypothetical protein